MSKHKKNINEDVNLLTVYEIYLMGIIANQFRKIPVKYWPHYISEMGGNLLIDLVELLNKNGYNVDTDMLEYHFDGLLKKVLGKLHKKGGFKKPLSKSLKGGEEELEEFVDKGGAPIEGDYPEVLGDDAYASTGNPKGAGQQTTDDAAHQKQQGNSIFMYRGFYGENEEDKLNPSKVKMKGMLEDIFSKKKFDDDIVKRIRDKEVTLNGIPSIEIMNDSNPIIVRKVNLLKDVIDRNTVSGEEKGIILNHLLDMDMSDIPREYKEEIKRKLG